MFIEQTCIDGTKFVKSSFGTTPLTKEFAMKPYAATFALSFLAAGALLLPDTAEARRFEGRGGHVAAHAGNFHSAGARSGGYRNVNRNVTAI
jgi:hypothetical protein